MFRHFRLTGLILLLGLAMVGTGCADNRNGDDPGGAPATTGAPDADPMSALTSATDALKREPFKMELSAAGVMSATGAVDPTAGLGHLSMTQVEAGQEVSIEFLITGDDMWANFDGIAGLPEGMTKWMHIDATKLPDGLMGLRPGDTDLVDATELLRGLGTVEQVDEHTFKSELDMTKARSDIIDGQLAATLPEDATKWPLTATIDEQGRLTGLVITFAHLTPPKSMEIRYFDYGTPVDVTPPPADQVSEMPEEFYQLFTG